MQLRVRTCVPPPHDTVQVPQAPQLDKPPSTETHNYVWSVLSNCLRIQMSMGNIDDECVKVLSVLFYRGI